MYAVRPDTAIARIPKVIYTTARSCAAALHTMRQLKSQMIVLPGQWLWAALGRLPNGRSNDESQTDVPTAAHPSAHCLTPHREWGAVPRGDRCEIGCRRRLVRRSRTRPRSSTCSPHERPRSPRRRRTVQRHRRASAGSSPAVALAGIRSRIVHSDDHVGGAHARATMYRKRRHGRRKGWRRRHG